MQQRHALQGKGGKRGKAAAYPGFKEENHARAESGIFRGRGSDDPDNKRAEHVYYQRVHGKDPRAVGMSDMAYRAAAPINPPAPTARKFNIFVSFLRAVFNCIPCAHIMRRDFCILQVCHLSGRFARV